MTQAIITLILGSVEIMDGGKKISAKKGTKISTEAKIKTASNAKVEIEVKDIIKMSGGSSDPTFAGGVRG